jgi:lysozyme
VNRDKLAARLVAKEGERLKLYRCTAGKLSIGVGRNIEDRGISKEESRYLLNNDIEWALAECEQQAWWSAVKDDDVRSRIMVEMCFNLGINRLNGFKKTLAALRRKDYPEAAKEMLDSKWARQVGKRADELAVMMIAGKDL